MSIKNLLRHIFSEGAVHRLRFVIEVLPRLPYYYYVKSVFNRAHPEQDFLDPRMLPELLKHTSSDVAEYSYSKDQLKARGDARARQLMALKNFEKAGAVLEIGCWDGMVSAALARNGYAVSAVDNRSEGLDSRAREEGVNFYVSDAGNLGFQDSLFDMVFSYDALEHVNDPGRVLMEMIRVVKPGGLMYLEFGPLYYSAFGEHAYRKIPLAYCSLLFDKKIIDVFLRNRNEKSIDWDHVNGWSLARYRSLWKNFDDKVEIIFLREGKNIKHLKLIQRFPSCFRAKGVSFEDFCISSISILMKKKFVV